MKTDILVNMMVAPTTANKIIPQIDSTIIVATPTPYCIKLLHGVFIILSSSPILRG